MIVNVLRPTWRFGGDSVILTEGCGRTQLFNPNGFMDILGWIAATAGVPTGKLMSCDSLYHLRLKHGIVIPHLPPEPAAVAMELNDRPLSLLDPHSKEDELMDYLSLFHIDVYFHGEYHTAVLDEVEETCYAL